MNIIKLIDAFNLVLTLLTGGKYRKIIWGLVLVNVASQLKAGVSVGGCLVSGAPFNDFYFSSQGTKLFSTENNHKISNYMNITNNLPFC